MKKSPLEAFKTDSHLSVKCEGWLNWYEQALREGLHSAGTARWVSQEELQLPRRSELAGTSSDRKQHNNPWHWPRSAAVRTSSPLFCQQHNSQCCFYNRAKDVKSFKLPLWKIQHSGASFVGGFLLFCFWWRGNPPTKQNRNTQPPKTELKTSQQSPKSNCSETNAPSPTSESLLSSWGNWITI